MSGFLLGVKVDDVARKKENMRVVISVGKDEIGASVLRRYLNARIEALRDSSNDLISASMACCWYSQESSLGSMRYGFTRLYRVKSEYPYPK